MVNFALFGAGRIGRMHAENLSRRGDARLLYVVDTNAGGGTLLTATISPAPLE